MRDRTNVNAVVRQPCRSHGFVHSLALFLLHPAARTKIVERERSAIVFTHCCRPMGDLNLVPRGIRSERSHLSMAKRIYVGGLPYSATDADLENLFSSSGTVTSAS